MKVRIRFDDWHIEVDNSSTVEDINKAVLDILMFKGIKNNLILNIEVIDDDQIKTNKECVS